MTNPFVILWAALTRGRTVYLKDCWGKSYTSIAYVNTFGTRLARVYPFSAIGHVILNDDGTTGGRSSYISEWRYAFCQSNADAADQERSQKQGAE